MPTNRRLTRVRVLRIAKVVTDKGRHDYVVPESVDTELSHGYQAVGIAIKRCPHCGRKKCVLAMKHSTGNSILFHCLNCDEPVHYD